METARELMTKELRTIEPNATLQSAAHLMEKYDIGMLPVITSEGEAVGMITDRDIAVRGVAKNRRVEEMKVYDAMTTGVEFCYNDDNLDQLARRMGEKRLRRLVVIDRNTKGIRGIVSLGDLAARCDDKKVAGAVLARCVGSD